VGIREQLSLWAVYGGTWQWLVAYLAAITLEFLVGIVGGYVLAVTWLAEIFHPLLRAYGIPAEVSGAGLGVVFWLSYLRNTFVSASLADQVREYTGEPEERNA